MYRVNPVHRTSPLILMRGTPPLSTHATMTIQLGTVINAASEATLSQAGLPFTMPLKHAWWDKWQTHRPGNAEWLQPNSTPLPDEMCVVILCGSTEAQADRPLRNCLYTRLSSYRPALEAEKQEHSGLTEDAWLSSSQLQISASLPTQCSCSVSL